MRTRNIIIVTRYWIFWNIIHCLIYNRSTINMELINRSEILFIDILLNWLD